LKFARNEGFRTPKTSSVFNALKRFESPGKGVAVRERLPTNSLSIIVSTSNG
jgi:hypothetical protein